MMAGMTAVNGGPRAMDVYRPAPRRTRRACMLALTLALLLPGAHALAADTAGALLTDEQNTIDIVQRYGPSVVAITVTVEGQRIDPLASLPPELRRFFERMGPDSPLGTPRTYTERAAGSGFVVDAAGHLVTNFHVVADALTGGTIQLKPTATIMVRFPGTARDLPVTLVGVDRSYDLALLRLRTSAERPARAIPIPLGDSGHLRVGQKVIAIGNPFALQSTVTQGIVSAVNRRQASAVSGVPIDYVQTDAAINPGNSGGPLLDSRGQLIGINDAILAPNGTFVGVGFAIPSDLLQSRLADLRAGGYLQKAQLGIQVIDLGLYPADVRRFLKLPAKGVMIVGVADSSPARKAGLHAARYVVTSGGADWPAGGDVIFAVDGKPVNESDDLRDVVYGKNKGDPVRLRYLRSGREARVTIVLDIVPSGG